MRAEDDKKIAESGVMDYLMGTLRETQDAASNGPIIRNAREYYETGDSDNILEGMGEVIVGTSPLIASKAARLAHRYASMGEKQETAARKYREKLWNDEMQVQLANRQLDFEMQRILKAMPTLAESEEGIRLAHARAMERVEGAHLMQRKFGGQVLPTEPEFPGTEETRAAAKKEFLSSKGKVPNGGKPAEMPNIKARGSMKVKAALTLAGMYMTASRLLQDDKPQGREPESRASRPYTWPGTTPTY